MEHNIIESILYSVMALIEHFDNHAHTGLAWLLGLGVCSLKVLVSSPGITQCTVLVGKTIQQGVGPKCLALKTFPIIIIIKKKKEEEEEEEEEKKGILTIISVIQQILITYLVEVGHP